jgi:putative membrane protein
VRFSDIFVLFVATLHFGFMYLEMALWQSPIGLKVFRQTREQAAASAVLASNQDLYNGFLGAGLFYGVLEANVQVGFSFKVFF